MNAAIAPLAEPHFEELRAVLVGTAPRHIEGTNGKR